MIGRMNGKKAVKAISLGLSIYMALVPMAVRADELSDAEVSLTEQIEVRDEAAANVEQAVEDAIITDSQAEFENMEIVANVEASDENISADTSILVEDTINLIENESIKEAADAIVNVDMSNVDDALEQVTELIANTLTDETVADQIEATTDALISIYDAKAETALNALKAISEEMDAVSVLDDGSVNIDWDAATDEVTGLYETYQAALAAKEEAQTAKTEIIEKKNAMSDKVNEINGGVLNDNKEVNEAVSSSKLKKSSTINEIIASVAELHSKDIKAQYTLDQRVSGSSDIYRFYINLVEGEDACGCLTYYDSESKTILRKNFKISSDGIDYDYVPDDELVKGNANCKKEVFGNSGNYIAAYVENTSGYIKSNKFDGPNVSKLMRDSVNLNNAIDARNQALIDLEEINRNIEKAEEELQNASENADNALKAYKEAVAMYKEAALLDRDVKDSNVEKAKLEYVKAEVEVWRRQQVLDQIKNTTNDANMDNEIEVVSDEAYENIENVINNIASNLDVKPEAVEEIVAEIIINTENRYVGETNYNEAASVLGERRDKETVVSEKKEVETINTPNVEKKVVIIEDEEVPLAKSLGDFEHSENWWILIIIALVCITGFLVYHNKKSSLC
ncbi:MAG: hypothetical protein MJZ11_12170 [Lachnospiraceae bacterium]|nr:hypothetical protein [Lachnospiraceae bacterium]